MSSSPRWRQFRLLMLRMLVVLLQLAAALAMVVAGGVFVLVVVQLLLLTQLPRLLLLFNSIVILNKIFVAILNSPRRWRPGRLAGFLTRICLGYDSDMTRMARM